ncbi:MAG: hypothetical protein ACI4GD_10505 [Lachnospiraceae bacterium]
MNKKLKMFSLLVYDKTGKIAGAVCISMTKNDVFFDLFEYLEEFGYIVDASVPGTHFHISGQFDNYQFMEKIDSMLFWLNEVVKEDLHIDEKPFHNMKNYFDFKRFYVDNFLN